MKKNDIFLYTTPGGDEVKAIVIDEVGMSSFQNGDLRLHTFLCYGKNMLFKYCWLEGFDHYIHKKEISLYQDIGKIVNYAILPEYDKYLKSAQLID